MDRQNQIKRVLSRPETIEYVGQLLEVDEFFREPSWRIFFARSLGFKTRVGKTRERAAC
jgi:hypothetical protein